MMANDKIEFDLVVNGKKAKDSINDVEDAQDDLDRTVKRTSKNIKANWMAIGAGAATAAIALASLARESMQVEKAMFGLNKETRAYIENASNYYAVNQEIIAGFVQTGKAAGMAGNDIKTMIDQAVALSRAYPEESIETFIDNLTMLNRTGEAQGYIVDILEQKWGTIDLKSKTLAEKMAVVEEATRGVNEEFDKTAGAKVDKVFQEISNEVLILGDELVTMGEKAVESFDELKKKAKGFFNWLHDKGVISFEFKTDIPDKPDDLDLGEIKIEGTKPPPEKPTTKPTGGTKPAGGISEADKQKSIALAANERFWDEYNKTIMSATEFELDQLNKKYLAYEENVTDKVALEEWFSKETARILEEDKQRTDEYAKLKEQLFDGLADSFVDFAMTGENTFDDMARSIIANLIKIQLQALMTQMLSGSFFGSMLGIHTGTPEVKHSGGQIGAVPSYHAGLRGDERYAKLQVGEAVINRSGAANNQDAIRAMNAGDKLGGGDNITTAEINFNVQAIDAASFDTYLVNNRKTIEGIISKSIASNGSVRKTIKQSI